jgi:hypothetical protein
VLKLRISSSVQPNKATDNVATSIAIAIDAFVENFVLNFTSLCPFGAVNVFPVLF